MPRWGSPIEGWKLWARRLKRDVYTLYLACKDPRVPWLARLFIACVVGYALSPVDLIPDFIPVLGYLDDLLLLPLGVALALKMIPPAILAECREKATRGLQDKRTSRIAGVAIGALWILAVVALVMLAVRVAY
jgi:uncharacterized membrane protein YkvA (DUF1232 family)